MGLSSDLEQSNIRVAELEAELAALKNAPAPSDEPAVLNNLVEARQRFYRQSGKVIVDAAAGTTRDEPRNRQLPKRARLSSAAFKAVTDWVGSTPTDGHEEKDKGGNVIRSNEQVHARRLTHFADMELVEDSTLVGDAVIVG